MAEAVRPVETRGRRVRDDLLLGGDVVVALAAPSFALHSVVVLAAAAGNLGTRRLGPGPNLFSLRALEPLLSSEVATVFKHVTGIGVQRPEGPLPGLVGGPGDLQEAVVEAERVSDGVLPTLLVLTVEGKQVHDELVNLTKGQHFARRVLNGHRDQADVGVGGLGVGIAAAVVLGVCPDATQCWRSNRLRRKVIS